MHFHYLYVDDLFLQLFMRDGLAGGTGSNELNEQRRDAEKTGHGSYSVESWRQWGGTPENESDPPRRKC